MKNITLSKSNTKREKKNLHWRVIKGIVKKKKKAVKEPSLNNPHSLNSSIGKTIQNFKGLIC